MTLSGRKMKALHRALLDAFPVRTELAHVVRFELEQELAQITAGPTDSDVVFQLVQWADSKNRVEALIRGARKHNPGNVLLRRIDSFVVWPARETAGALLIFGVATLATNWIFDRPVDAREILQTEEFKVNTRLNPELIPGAIVRVSSNAAAEVLATNADCYPKLTPARAPFPPLPGKFRLESLRAERAELITLNANRLAQLSELCGARVKAAAEHADALEVVTAAVVARDGDEEVAIAYKSRPFTPRYTPQ